MIAEELNVTPVLDKIQEYMRKWMHVNRMPRNRLPRIAKKTTDQRQKEPGETNEETSGCVRPERVSKWPNSMIAILLLLLFIYLFFFSQNATHCTGCYWHFNICINHDSTVMRVVPCSIYVLLA